MTELCLVTGGAGFIGSHLVDGLLSAGFAVRVLDDLSSGHMENLADSIGRIEFVHGSVAEPAMLDKVMRGVTYVFHLAALAAVPESIQNPLKSLELNDLAVYHVYRAAAGAGARRVILSSSSAVYGDRPAPHHEQLCPAPDTPYAAHKLIGEHYGLFFRARHGLDSVYLRYFNVYGPRQIPDSPYSGVISIFVEKFLAGENPEIFDDGQQTRDFVYVSDVVAANLAAARLPNVSGEAINIGAGRAVSILRLYDLLAEMSGRPNAPVFLPPREGDIKHSSGPVEKAARLLGLVPKIDFETGLRRTFDFFVRRRGHLDN